MWTVGLPFQLSLVVMRFLALLVILSSMNPLVLVVSQQALLYNFYRSTSNWAPLCRAGWSNNTSPLCFGSSSSWYGVSCVSGSVTQISLADCGIRGTLPTQWSSLTSLLYLGLESNSLNGTLPPQWSNMTSLQRMYLNSNSLNGTLPPEWSSMTSLQYLYVWNNSLNGTLPLQWSSLTSLQSLSLGINSLSGTLPPEWSAMANLQLLYLWSNYLSGTLPSQWSALSVALKCKVQTNCLLTSRAPSWWLDSNRNIGSQRKECVAVSSPTRTLPVANITRSRRLGSNAFSGPWHDGSSTLSLGVTRSMLPTDSPQSSHTNSLKSSHSPSVATTHRVSLSQRNSISLFWPATLTVSASSGSASVWSLLSGSSTLIPSQAELKLTTSPSHDQDQSVSPSPTPNGSTLSRNFSSTMGNSLSTSGCDDALWSVSLLTPSLGLPSASPNNIVVGYDWLSTLNQSAITVVFAGLWPWHLVGVHVAGEALVVELLNASSTANVTAVRLSPLPNSTLMASGDDIWPGVRRSSYASTQTVFVALDLKCRAEYSFREGFTLAVMRLPGSAISSTLQLLIDSAQQISSVSVASASTVARASLAISLASCLLASEATDSPADVTALFPIPFYNSGSPNDDIVNALIVNYVLILSFAAVVVGAAVTVSWAAGMPLAELLLLLRWPSILCPGFASTLPSSVSAISSFISRAVDGSLLDGELAPCAISCGVAVIVWLWYCVWIARVCYSAPSIMTSQAKPTGGDDEAHLAVGCRAALRCVFRSRWQWVPNNASDEGPFDVFLRKHQSAFSELRVPWYTATDIWATLLSSVVSALPRRSVTGCIGIAATNVAIALSFFVIATVVRPYGSPFGTVHLTLMQGGSLICSGCVLAYMLAPVDALLSVAAITAVCVGAVALCRTVTDLVELGRMALMLYRLVVRSRAPVHHLSTIMESDVPHEFDDISPECPPESIATASTSSLDCIEQRKQTFNHREMRMRLLIQRICVNSLLGLTTIPIGHNDEPLSLRFERWRDESQSGSPLPALEGSQFLSHRILFFTDE